MFRSKTSDIIKKRRLRERINRVLKLVITLVLLVGFTGILYRVIRKSEHSVKPGSDIENLSGEDSLVSESVAEVARAVEDGNYALARKRIEDRLRKSPDDREIKKLKSLLMGSLEVNFKFNYLPGRRRQISTRGPSADLVLTRKDPYYLIVHPSDKCFLYLFQLESSGELAKLFPNSKYVPTPNPVPGGPIRVPDGYEWFYLDDTPGTETIYLIASRWRQKALETLCAKLESEDDTYQKREIIREILFRLEREAQTTDDIPGLVFAKHQFRHEKAPR